MVIYTGDQGPFGFDPAAEFPGHRGSPKQGIDLETFLAAYLPGRPERTSRSSRLPGM
jgi:hypothetical protein